MSLPPWRGDGSPRGPAAGEARGLSPLRGGQRPRGSVPLPGRAGGHPWGRRVVVLGVPGGQEGPGWSGDRATGCLVGVGTLL